MRKLYSRIIPKWLMTKQKQHQLDVATNWFEQCVPDPNFTGDESWFFEYDPSDQQANKAYMKEGEPNLKTPHQSRSNFTSMLILFFDRRGIVHHEFFRPTPEASGINVQRYLDILKWLRPLIARIRPELFATNSWVLHHNNIPPYMSHVAADWLAKKWNDLDVTLFVFTIYGPVWFLGIPKSQKSIWNIHWGSVEEIERVMMAGTEGTYTRRIRRLFPAVGGALVQVR